VIQEIDGIVVHAQMRTCNGIIKLGTLKENRNDRLLTAPFDT